MKHIDHAFRHVAAFFVMAGLMMWLIGVPPAPSDEDYRFIFHLRMAFGFFAGWALHGVYRCALVGWDDWRTKPSVLGLAVILLLVAPTPADASCYSYSWRRVCDNSWPVPSCWRQRYCQRWAPDYERYYRSPREVILEREVDNPRRHCEAPVHAVGLERYGHERAKESADAQWAEAVRAKAGGRFMDLRNAQNVAYECWQSSTGNRASEKTGEAVGGKLEQCEVRASPCRAQKEGAER